MSILRKGKLLPDQKRSTASKKTLIIMVFVFLLDLLLFGLFFVVVFVFACGVFFLLGLLFFLVGELFPLRKGLPCLCELNVSIV